MRLTRLTRFAGLRAFSHRAYRSIWLGALVSNIGTWMETISVGVFVTQTTGRAGWTGTVAALGYMPAVLLGPLAGALADRFERRRYLQYVTSAQLFLAAVLTLLAWTGHLSLLSVAALVGLIGCANTLLGPAFNALLADLVPRRDLMSAIALTSAQFNVARVLGPALAAPAIVVGGLAFAFGVNVVSFVAVLVALAQVAVPPLQREGPAERLWGGIGAGFKLVATDRGIRTSLGVIGVTALLIAPFIGLVPAFAIKVLHRGAAGTSMLVGFQGVGAVMAALGSAGLSDTLGRRRVVEGAVWLLGPLAALYWVAPTLPVAAGSVLMLGAVYLAVVTSTSSVCLSRAPRALQARVSSLFSLVLSGGYAVGLVTLGWLGDRLGLRAVGASAALLYVALVGGARLLRPELFAALETPGAPPLQPDVAPPGPE